MIDDLPTNISPSRGRDEHIEDHNRLHARMNQMVYSNDYPNVQAAINAAISNHRPLLIAPGTYLLDSPIRVVDSLYLTVFAYNAVFTCSTPISGLLEVEDSKFLNWFGGRFSPDATCDNAIYIYGDDYGASFINLRDVICEGKYIVGIRVGQPDNTIQCDEIYLDNIYLYSLWKPGIQEIHGSEGLHLGSDVYGNCLNLSASRITVSAHDKLIVVSAAEYVNLSQLNLAGSDTADIVTSGGVVSIRDVRSELSRRFMVTPGNATTQFMVTVDCVLFAAQLLAEDGEWIRYNYSGGLTLSNVNARNAPQAIQATIKCSPIAPLTVRNHGVFNSTITGNVNVSIKE